MPFITDLWDSVFTPGTTPALIKATHGSFIALIISLVVLIFLTRSIHFVNLLVIACLLYASVVWFISELNAAKLKSNDELEIEEKEKENDEKKEIENVEQEIAKTTATDKKIKKRKA